MKPWIASPGILVGLLMAIIYSANSLNICQKIEDLSPERGLCNCTYQNELSKLELTNCNKLVLPLNYFNYSKSKVMVSITNAVEVTITNVTDHEVNEILREMSLMVNFVTTVIVTSKAFDQMVISTFFRDIKNLTMADKSFSSCWGNVWMINTTLQHMNTNSPFSSSDIVVWDGTTNKFKTHVRPEGTPVQKFVYLYRISSKIQELEVLIYSIIALCGAIVVTLIFLTACVTRQSGSQPDIQTVYLEKKQNLPDVVPTQPTTLARERKKNKSKGPVIKLSRFSKAFGAKGEKGKRKRNEKTDTKPAENHHLSPRPPLPFPNQQFEHL